MRDWQADVSRLGNVGQRIFGCDPVLPKRRMLHSRTLAWNVLSRKDRR